MAESAGDRFLRDLHKARTREERRTGRNISNRELEIALKKSAAQMERSKNVTTGPGSRTSTSKTGATDSGTSPRKATSKGRPGDTGPGTSPRAAKKRSSTSAGQGAAIAGAVAGAGAGAAAAFRTGSKARITQPNARPPQVRAGNAVVPKSKLGSASQYRSNTGVRGVRSQLANASGGSRGARIGGAAGGSGGRGMYGRAGGPKSLKG